MTSTTAAPAGPTTDRTPTATARRALASTSLVLAALMSLAWTVTEPAFPDGYAARLAAIEEGGTTALVSAALFSASQLPMLVALLAVGHLARHGAPRLALVGTALGVVGCLGHAVYGGVSLMSVLMARDVANRGVHVELLAQAESAPGIIAFAAAGLLGTVLSFLLLGIALFRSRVVARWVPCLLWLFLVVEFAGGGLSEYATLASALFLLIAFSALALAVRARPADDWT